MDLQKELIAEYDREVATTRKMLAAVPVDADFAWKPHTKSMALGRLAGHVAETAGEWAISTLTREKLEFAKDHKFQPYVPASTAAMLAKFDEQTNQAKAALKDLPIEKWDQNWKFVYGDQTWINGSKYEVWRTWVVDHLIHHRAQLGVYLRLLDKPIPGSYGPSADESF
jgi:uncharacterized damage-inducible protein DinB